MGLQPDRASSEDESVIIDNFEEDDAIDLAYWRSDHEDDRDQTIELLESELRESHHELDSAHTRIDELNQELRSAYERIDETYNAFDQYQQFTEQTVVYPRETPVEALTYTSLGLTSEAREIAGKIKKVLRDRGGYVDQDVRDALVHETGDVLWYVARVA